MPDFVADLWRQVRPDAVQRATRLVAAAQDWRASGDPEAWTWLADQSHQLAGSLGSFGLVDAAGAARALLAETGAEHPDPDRLVDLARTLLATLEAT